VPIVDIVTLLVMPCITPPPYYERKIYLDCVVGPYCIAQRYALVDLTSTLKTLTQLLCLMYCPNCGGPLIGPCWYAQPLLCLLLFSYPLCPTLLYCLVGDLVDLGQHLNIVLLMMIWTADGTVYLVMTLLKPY